MRKLVLSRYGRRIGERVFRAWTDLRMWRHTMRFATPQDMVRQDDGALVSTGFHPRVDLISDRARLPRRWCWVGLSTCGQGDPADVPRLLVHPHGSSTVETFLLGPIDRPARPLLHRLPDHSSRLELVLGNRPGGPRLLGVQIKEVGKLRLLAGLVLQDPGSAWRAYRATPSFTHFKTQLIETQQKRQLPAEGPQWWRIYASGAHPSAIRAEGRIAFAIVLNASGFDAASIEAAIASVAAQTYTRWQLMVCGPENPLSAEAIGRNTGRPAAISVFDADADIPVSELIESEGADYLLFMDAATSLEPHALARFAAAAASDDADMLYGDSLLVAEDGVEYVALNALPVFSHDSYLRSPDQFGPIALRGAIAVLADGLDRLASGNAAEVVLRALEQRLRVTQIPDVLSRSRLSRRALSQGRADQVAAHLRRLGYREAQVTPVDTVGAFAIRRHVGPDARILAVVPTKNQRSLLETCVTSLRATTRNIGVDIAIVDHDSTEADTLAYLDRLSLTGVRILRHQGPFNYSALNNAAVSRFGEGYDFYLFLNNDIEAEQDGWLDAMLDLALQPDVGVVGATLLYPDRRIQHAGVVCIVGAAEHAYRYASLDGYRPYHQGPHLTREYSAVTGACMLVKGATFLSAGGFDERLAVGFNDIDLCLRIRATGLRVFQCAEAVLIHHESASRGKLQDGRDQHPDDTRLFFTRYADFLAKGDPFFSPLLDLKEGLFLPRPFLLREDRLHFRTVIHHGPTQAPGCRP